jgi:ATP phosphoribosyltransferase
LIDGVVDIAIVGDNLLVEKEREVIQKLGFSKCKVSVAVPKTFEYNSIKDLDGLRIATLILTRLMNILIHLSEG